MISRLALLFFVTVILGYSSAAIACSPVDPDADYKSGVIVSQFPAKEVPVGAIQLQLGKDNDLFSNSEKITLSVEKVVNGKFAGSKILLNRSNANHCNNHFGFPEEGSFITVLPMEYPDGEPILNKQGMQEYGAFFYEGNDLPPAETKPKPEFAVYREWTDFSFYDAERINCLEKGEESTETWRKCISRGDYIGLACQSDTTGKLVCRQDDLILNGRPPDLERNYSFWSHYGWALLMAFVMLAVLLGMGFYSYKVDPETNST